MKERLFNFKPVKLPENLLNNLYSSVEKYSKNHFHKDDYLFFFAALDESVQTFKVMGFSIAPSQIDFCRIK